MTNWGKFDTIPAAELQKEAAALDNGEFKEVPVGKYEVALIGLELKPTKKDGFPMVAAQFKILEGEFKNSRLFMNQVVIRGDEKDAVRLNIANRFLKSLEPSKEVIFEGTSAYEALIEEIFNELEDAEYLLDYGDKNGFKTFKIIERFE